MLLPGHQYQCRERQYTGASPSTLYKMTAFYRSLKRLISPPGGTVNRAFSYLMGCSSQHRRACCRSVVLTPATTGLLCSLGAMTPSALAGSRGGGARQGHPCTQELFSRRLPPPSHHLPPCHHARSCSGNRGGCRGTSRPPAAPAAVGCPRAARPRAALPWGLAGAGHMH